MGRAACSYTGYGDRAQASKSFSERDEKLSKYTA